MKFCNRCVNIIDDESCICDECKESLSIINIEEALDFSQCSSMHEEFKKFILSRRNKSVLYAYSGGQDSTAVLFLLQKMCKEYNVNLELFTIENGFKGEKTWNNINNVIDYLNLRDYYKVYDIRNNIVTDNAITKLFGKDKTVEEIYALCLINNILPCGKICNSIMDSGYKDVLQVHNEDYLITGGDTPKLNDGRYSVVWHKKNGLNIIRGGVGFRISKDIGRDIIKNSNIPWTNPNYGGYDTDCIIPGTVFANGNNGLEDISMSEIMEKYPVVFEYLKERSRLGIIGRENALKSLSCLDVNNYSGYIEANKSAIKVLKRRIIKDVPNK